MTIRFTTSLVGAGWSHTAGDVVDFDDAEAVRLINGGIAEVFIRPEQIETATATDQELQRATLEPERISHHGGVDVD